jgi:hypothetical protein
MRARTFILVLAAVALLALPALAAEDEAGAVDSYVELLRKDIEADKVLILTEALDLPDQEAQKFWPVYRKYEAALAEIGDRRLMLIKKFADRYGSLTNEDAAEIAREWFDLQDDRAKLRKEYYKKVQKATSTLTAARFTQIEHVIGMLLDLQVATELPLME